MWYYQHQSARQRIAALLLEADRIRLVREAEAASRARQSGPGRTRRSAAAVVAFVSRATGRIAVALDGRAAAGLERSTDR